jgi:uncharacterized protein YjiK
MYGVWFALLVGLAGITVTSCAVQNDTPPESEENVVAERPPVTTADARNISSPDVDFSRAAATFELPEQLVEISGLTLLDASTIGAVNDEDGVLYELDLDTGDVTAEHRFGGKGDYEGISLAGDRLFVLEADGALLEIQNWQSQPDARAYDTGLKKKCDAEGLGYDRGKDRLLIACKEPLDRDMKNTRTIFAFDLNSNRLQKDPVYLIETDALGLSDKKDFKPSALAVHPESGRIYVLSSVRQAIVVLDPAGDVVAEWDLDGAGFEQPEGLAWLPNGDLLISSEGVERSGVVKRFAVRASQ